MREILRGFFGTVQRFQLEISKDYKVRANGKAVKFEQAD